MAFLSRTTGGLKSIIGENDSTIKTDRISTSGIIFKPSYQGLSYGFTAGGGTAGNSYTDIAKFPFASDVISTDHGNIHGNRSVYQGAGTSSSTHGYVSGGIQVFTHYNNIDKFSFFSASTTSDVGNLTTAGGRYGGSGQSSSTHGYTSGGYDFATAGVAYNVIDRFPFSTDTNASDFGDLIAVTFKTSRGNNSELYGYVVGGSPTGTESNVIQKFPFASNSGSSDVGDTIIQVSVSGGQNSDINGYISGSLSSGTMLEKFSFQYDANSKDVGELFISTMDSCGHSSFNNGYVTGGFFSPPFIPFATNTIQKFPFSTDTNASDLGDLAFSFFGGPTGHQV